MNTIIRHVLTASIVATLVTGFAVPVNATQGSDARKITVKFADLDISTPEGAAALYSRIRTAARNVCPQPDDPWRTSDSCVHEAIADAVTKVNQPMLFAVYNEHYKPSLSTTLLARTR